jgi:superfamily II DNA or RNA helicase
MTQYYTVIYWYTSPLNRKEHRVKNGSARRKADSAYNAAEIRIKEQLTAKDSADPYEILYVEDVSDKCETGDESESLSNLRQLEQNWLHAKQKRMGMWVPADSQKSEWFFDLAHSSVNNVVEVGKSLINEWRHGVSRPNAYLMRDEQLTCHDQAVEHFRSGGEKFLMNAKMRFGKTFTSYQIMRTLGVQRALVLTYKPAVDASWREDLETHIDFEGWHYHSAKDFDAKNPIQLNGDGIDILFTSFQDFNDFEKAKWQYARDYKYDLVVIDEMHYGSKTERAQQSLAQLNYDRILYVSGTPLKALMSGEFLDEEIYTWGYADEQSKRKAEKDANWETELYRWLPVMKFHTFEVSEEAKKLVNAYSEEEGFTMTKMFGSDDGEKFNDDSAVKLFLDQMFGIGVRKEKSPIRTHAVDHLLMVLPPNVKSATAMSKMLQQRVGDDYFIINVSGDNVTSLEKVKQYIMTYDKTITVTCGRFNTGVTVPEWDMVMMLDDTRAPETYFQTIFRCQSPDKKRGKELCSIIDFNPQRCLEMIYEFADITAKKGESTQQAVRSFLEFAPVLDHSGNKPKEVDVNQILKMMAETGGYAERFGSSVMLNWSELDNVANKFFGIRADASAASKSTIADNGLEKGKNYDKNGTPKSKAEIDAEAKAEKELRQKVITMMRRLPTYLFLETASIDNVENIVYNNNTELFEETVGITIDSFKELCSGLIKTDRLDRAIMAYNQIESM